MSEKTCWLVDKENGIATDGKRYWCVGDMIRLDHAVEVLALYIFASENLCCRNCGSSNILQDDWDEASEKIKDEYINEARELLK